MYFLIQNYILQRRFKFDLFVKETVMWSCIYFLENKIGTYGWIELKGNTYYRWCAGCSNLNYFKRNLVGLGFAYIWQYYEFSFY